MRAPLNATVFCHSIIKVGVRASPSWLPMISKRAFFPACLANSPQQDVMLACCSVGLRTSLRFTPSFSFNIRARLQANLLFCSLRIFVLITTKRKKIVFLLKTFYIMLTRQTAHWSDSSNMKQVLGEKKKIERQKKIFSILFFILRWAPCFLSSPQYGAA